MVKNKWVWPQPGKLIFKSIEGVPLQGIGTMMEEQVGISPQDKEITG